MITQGYVNSAPADVGVRTEGLARLNQFFLDAIEAKNIQAAGYIVSRNGKIFAHNAMGSLSGIQEDGGAFLPDSIHNIASATKVFTAAAIMKLVEQGKISLEQPVSTILPEFANPTHEIISIMHLVTHTSGLRADPGAHNEPYPRPFWSDEMNAKNWIPAMLEGPLQYPIGEVWNYCTAGFQLLGEVVSKVSGMAYPEFMQQYFFDPLEMTRTFFDVPDEYRASVCIVDETDMMGLDWVRNPELVGSWLAGGGIYSTPMDIWKFGQMILDKGAYNGNPILSRKIVEAMTRNHLVSVPSYNWGIHTKDKQVGVSWEIDKDPTFSPGTVSHEGFGWTSLFIDPQEGLVYVGITPTKADWWVAKPMIPRTLVLSSLE